MTEGERLDIEANLAFFKAEVAFEANPERGTWAWDERQRLFQAAVDSNDAYMRHVKTGPPTLRVWRDE